MSDIPKEQLADEEPPEIQAFLDWAYEHYETVDIILSNPNKNDERQTVTYRWGRGKYMMRDAVLEVRRNRDTYGDFDDLVAGTIKQVLEEEGLI